MIVNEKRKIRLKESNTFMERKYGLKIGDKVTYTIDFNHSKRVIGVVLGFNSDDRVKVESKEDGVSYLNPASISSINGVSMFDLDTENMKNRSKK